MSELPYPALNRHTERPFSREVPAKLYRQVTSPRPRYGRRAVQAHRGRYYPSTRNRPIHIDISRRYWMLSRRHDRSLSATLASLWPAISRRSPRSSSLDAAPPRFYRHREALPPRASKPHVRETRICVPGECRRLSACCIGGKVGFGLPCNAP